MDRYSQSNGEKRDLNNVVINEHSRKKQFNAACPHDYVTMGSNRIERINSNPTHQHPNPGVWKPVLQIESNGVGGGPVSSIA